MGSPVKVCEQCGHDWPDQYAYCGACGHELGRPSIEVVHQQSRSRWEPDEPTVVNVRVVNGFLDSCLNCFGTAIGIIVIVFVIAWIISSC